LLGTLLGRKPFRICQDSIGHRLRGRHKPLLGTQLGTLLGWKPFRIYRDSIGRRLRERHKLLLGMLLGTLPGRLLVRGIHTRTILGLRQSNPKPLWEKNN